MNHGLEPQSINNLFCGESDFSRYVCSSGPGCISSGHSWWFFARSEPLRQLVSAKESVASVQRTAKMRRLEAVLFVADCALSIRRLAHLATLVDASEARLLIDKLNSAYDQIECVFRIERVAAGYRLLTRAEFSVLLDKLYHRRTALKLSSPAMETLAIVAYRQPIVRADIEGIRGVRCVEMLKQLMEHGLVRIAGEDESLGRPYLYETTHRFLELVGLHDLDDLPMAERLRRAKQERPCDEDAAPVENQMDNVA